MKIAFIAIIIIAAISVGVVFISHIYDYRGQAPSVVYTAAPSATYTPAKNSATAATGSASAANNSTNVSTSSANIVANSANYDTSSASNYQTASTSAQDPCQGLPNSVASRTTGAMNGPIISFDFDDGFISAYDNALPVINGAGFPTTQYIISGDLNMDGRVSAQQVLAMQAAGNEIGAHTRTHPFLTRLPISQAKEEICGSRRDLINLGIAAKTFAYPEGDFNSAVENIVRQAGFAGARTTEAGLNNRTTNPFLLRSYQMNASTTFAQIKYAIDQAVADKEWLTIVFHRTDESGNPISVTHQLISQIVQYVKSTGMPVVTESQGLAIMRNISGTVNDLKSYVPPTKSK